jgi:hypothetical protein
MKTGRLWSGPHPVGGGRKFSNEPKCLTRAIKGVQSSARETCIGVGLPGVSIGIHLPVYPQLVRVPGYPVYYAPQTNSNYFFYDDMYWVYERDNWCASTWCVSTWYNGPWGLVSQGAVPLYILRVPVRYYRQPPAYFCGGRSDAPPRWDEHWGPAWAQNHTGWNEWNRGAVAAPAPVPTYQRQYSGNQYPPVQQQALQSQNYRYQPRDAGVQQHYQAERAQSLAAHPQLGGAPASRGQPPQIRNAMVPQPAPYRQGEPGNDQQRQQSPQAASPHGQQGPNAQGQDNGARGNPASQEGKRGQA